MKPIRLLFTLAGISVATACLVALAGCSRQSGSSGGAGGYDGQSTATMLATISVNPDATELVFAGAVAAPNGGDTKNLFTLDLKTLSVTRLTTTDECQSDPAYSFDGKKIVYVSRAHENEPSHIFICEADGTHPRQVTTVPNVEDHYPAFSRDGTRLVFSRSNRFIPDRRGYDTWTDIDVYTVKTDGTDDQRLTTAKYNCSINPVFYPNGKRILFEQGIMSPTDYSWTVHICQAELPSEREEDTPPISEVIATSNSDAFPFFYPDGEHVAFCSNQSLSRYDLKTNTKVLLHPMSNGGADNCPMVTQDGKQIYFLRAYGANIWVLDTATNAAHQVADGSIFDNPLGWKPSR